MSPPFIWTEARKAALKELWASGVASREIAARLGAPNGHAVRYKASHMGLPSRVPPKEVHERRWTEDRVALLKELWVDQSITIGAIAQRLGALINAHGVVSKASSLGLTPRSVMAAVPAPAPIEAKPAPAVIKEVKDRPRPRFEQGPVVVSIQPRQRDRGLTLFELQACQCRFVLDERDEGERLFCGRAHARTSKFSYCEDHLDVVLGRSRSFRQAAE